MSVPPEEVLQNVDPRAKSEYLAWRAATDLRTPYRVAPEFLAGTKPEASWDVDVTPLIVFINARSGGRVGPELANVLSRSLGRSQVFDLGHYRPDKVLAQIWQNLEDQERHGNPRAALVRHRLRILTCGGDGTVAWIMKVVKQLNLQPQPAVAIMPLGTGNDLSRSFSWGPEFEWNWIKGPASIYSTLKRIADASVMDLDCWRLRLTLPDSSYQPAKTYAMAQVVGDEAAAVKGSQVLMEGVFYNYFSVGADAQAAYNFHHLRDEHPMLASNRLANQFWYSTFSCTSGWFCGTVPSVSRFSELEVLLPGAAGWTALSIPSSIKALVFVNLQSYGGGRNIWGEHVSSKKEFKQPALDDGLIEVVGFTHGYHAMAVMASHAKMAHGKRLAQVAGLRLALHDAIGRPDNEPGKVFMQLDGEPWMQSIPAGSTTTKVMLEVTHCGVSKLLSNKAQPDSHPTEHMTEMLGEKEAEAYLVHPEAREEAVPVPVEAVPQHGRQTASEPGRPAASGPFSSGGPAAAAAAAASEGGVGWPDRPTQAPPAAAAAARTFGTEAPAAVAVIEATGLGGPPKPLGGNAAETAASAAANPAATTARY